MWLNINRDYFLIIVLCVIIYITDADKCVTPNGETADCISIHKCPVLLNAIKTEEETAIEFARKSQCGYDSAPLVCCGKSGNFEKLSTELLPDRRYCGFQHSDDYFSNRNENSSSSSIDEFPWLVALIYQQKGKEKNFCVGTLINNRYVLTTAHCVKINVKDTQLTKVVLGEYNIEQNKDCVSHGDLEECSEPTANFGIEETFIHERYNQKMHSHDVALIRLNSIVQYSDYIRPICLPLPGFPRAKVGDILFESGWGRTQNGATATTKKKILTKLIATDVCSQAYKKHNYIIQEGQICTKDIRLNFTSTCQGDSGGPVMFAHKNQWFQEGIVAFGARCGSETPDVHINVADYVDWIVKTVRP